MPAVSSPSITAIRRADCIQSSSNSTARSTWTSGGANEGCGSPRWPPISPRWRMRWPPFRSATWGRSRRPRNNSTLSFRGAKRTRNLEIPRCAIAHLRSGPSDHPGMTATQSLLHQRTRRIGRAERILAGNFCEDLVVVPWVFGFFRLLDLDQHEVVNHQVILAESAVAGKEILDR